VDVALKLSPVKDAAGTIMGVSAIAGDITQRKRAEEELRRTQEQLRALAAHLQAVREEERTRISREIHDELGQILTSLKMDLRWIERKRAATTSAEVEKGITLKIVEAQKLIDDTIQTVQRIAADLRPSVLDNLGLPAAIRYEAKRFEERTGIHSTLTLPEEMPVPDRDTATNLFRIFQEILTNVARHAGATAIGVELKEEHGGFALDVQDDGSGISADASSKPTSLGLLGMVERVASLDGTLYIEGTPGRGTKVTVRVPRKPA
jgi:signal transduction histidine kinase